MKSESKLSYMPHVDGLRAFAVLSVIFFHFAIPGFGGGYIGVDVFFVISGFLITRLISHEIASTGKFSFLHFYKRRIRRLLPALFFVLTMTSIVSIILLTPENLMEFGVSLPAAALSVSNILFWFQSGYFDTASHLKPLLHTWSLSVEEQYYLIWPAFMVLVWRAGSVIYKLIPIILIGLISFYLNYYFVHKAEPGFNSTIFFLAPFRVFEFTIGALGVFLIGNKYLKSDFQEFIAIAGIVLILASLLLLNSKSIFPYVNALAPCLGALFIILAQDSKIVKWLFGNKLTVSVGLISYSLYLVHWPIYVFTKYSWLNISSIFFVTAMLLVTFIFAVFIYRFVESPLRKTSAKPFFKSVAFICVCMCLLGVALKFSNGWAWRYANAPLTATQIEDGKSKRFIGIQSGCNLLLLENAERCHMDRPIQILLFGNSHEPDGYNIFNYLYGANDQVNIISFGTVNDCNLEVKEDEISSSVEALDCARRVATLNNPEFINALTHVVYSNHTGFEYVAKSLWLVIENLSKRNSQIKTIVLGSYLETSLDCSTIRNKDGSFDACKKPEYVTYFRPNERAESLVPQVHTLDYLYISKFDLLCPDKQLSSCLTYANGEPMFYDVHHLSYSFARYLGMLISNKYGKELVEVGLPSPNRKPDIH